MYIIHLVPKRQFHSKKSFSPRVSFFSTSSPVLSFQVSPLWNAGSSGSKWFLSWYRGIDYWPFPPGGWSTGFDLTTRDSYFTKVDFFSNFSEQNTGLWSWSLPTSTKLFDNHNFGNILINGFLHYSTIYWAKVL